MKFDPKRLMIEAGIMLQAASAEQLRMALELLAGISVMMHFETQPLPEELSPEQMALVTRAAVAVAIIDTLNQAARDLIQASECQQSAEDIAQAAIKHAARVDGNNTKH